MKNIHRDLASLFDEDAVAFESSSRNLEKSQCSKLNAILALNADSLFGRSHRFNEIDSVSAFQACVPLSEYEDYVDLLVSHEKVNAGVLTNEAVYCFVETSGTTRGKKRIPYTQSLLRDFQQGIAPWLYDIYQHVPSASSGAWYWSISPLLPVDDLKVGDIPVGLPSDLAYFSEAQSECLSSVLICPDVDKISDLEIFFEKTGHELEASDDLVFVSVWSPTFLSSLASHGSFSPALISCWGDGNSKPYCEDLKKLFPNSIIQPKGLISTEGFCSFPMVGVEGHVLSVNSHFFEFLDERGRVYTAGEIVVGREYEMVITTSGGFYRYRTHDIVEVIGYYHELPTFRFLRRDRTSDLVGEKLSEEDVIRMRDVLGVRALLMSPSRKERKYRVFMDHTISQGDKDRAENELKKNPYMAHALEAGQLDPIEWYQIKTLNLSSEYLCYKQKLGVKLGDIKPPLLENEDAGEYFLSRSTCF